MRTKVLLSVAEDDLKRIDELADSAGLSRSEYMVAMARQGNVNLFDAIGNLQRELTRFQADNAGWRTEAKRNEEHVRDLDKRLEKIIHFAGELGKHLDSVLKSNKQPTIKLLQQLHQAMVMFEKIARGGEKPKTATVI